MLLDFENFVRAAPYVDSIMRGDGHDLHQQLIDAANEVPQGQKREYYRHLSSLFLNVILNRTEEFGPTTESRAVECRRQILEILNTLGHV